jgi:hypothetical protein
MGSGAMTYITSLMKNGSEINMFIRWDAETYSLLDPLTPHSFFKIRTVY